jgi:hypothetical protein
MAYKQKGNINFGEGTKGFGPNKIKKWLSPKWLAAEGYYNAYQNYKENKRKKKEIEEYNEKLKWQKDYMEMVNDPNVDPRLKTIGHATYGQVQVWDEKLGRKRWVQDMDAYYEKMKKEGRDPITGQKLPPVEKDNNKKEEEEKTQKIPAVGTEARKKYYDSKKWKYDDTIKGYNRDGTKKEEEKDKPVNTEPVDDKPVDDKPVDDKPIDNKKKKEKGNPFN